VSPSKPNVDPPTRNPYKRPAIKKLTLEKAKEILKLQPQEADDNIEKMLKQISRLEGE
jgi:hypothetical protein